MKKIFALILALYMLSSVAALAETEITAAAPEVEVNLGAEFEENQSFNNSFKVYIPESIEFIQGCEKTYAEIRMEIYDDLDWCDGTKLQVALKRTAHFSYYKDDEQECWFAMNYLSHEGNEYNEQIDGCMYDIEYVILNENNETLIPWEYDVEEGAECPQFDNYCCGEIMKYIWCMGDVGERVQSQNLCFRICAGDFRFFGGRYSDTLTFCVNFGSCDAGELYYEANGVKVPNPIWSDEYGSEVFVDNDGNEYYRRWGDEYGEHGTYYLIGSDTPADVSGITEMHLEFTAWEDALSEDGNPIFVGDDNMLVYNDFINDSFSVMPADMYVQLCPEDETSNWLNDLSFNPNESDWVW